MLARYSRHLLLPQVGTEGQERLARARILCVGAGGLGSASLPYLAAAGVGSIGLIDDDTVDESNLQRQTIYGERDIGRLKVDAARERLSSINSEISIAVVAARLDVTNARDVVRHYDVVIDGTDNVSTRYILNDACYLESRALVYGAIAAFEGQVSVFERGKTPCYRCLFPTTSSEPPNCSQTGVLGVLPGVIGALQATEALKLVLGIGEPLYGRLLLYDALEASTQTFAFGPEADCALCGNKPSIVDVAGVDGLAVDLHRSVDGRDLIDFLEQQPHVRILDVRERTEYRDPIGHSIHIPASELVARLDELSPSQPYLVACQVGLRSQWAVEQLRRRGFATVFHLDGGFARAAFETVFGL